MPIYAYKCAACGHEKDALQKISDAPLTVCPSCGAEAFSKQVTAAGFQLKGSGWYVTDFRDSGRKKDGAAKDKPADAAPATETKTGTAADGAAAAPPGKTETASGAKTESAPAATPAPKSPAPPPTGG